MKLKFSEMTLARLQSTKVALIKRVNECQKDGNEKLERRYLNDLANVNRWLSIRSDEQEQRPVKEKDTEKKTLLKDVQKMLDGPWNAGDFVVLMNRLRRYQQNKLLKG